MKIEFNSNFSSEKKYIINCVLNHFLGLQYEVIIDDSIEGYRFVLENGAFIIIADSFFSRITKIGYLTKDFIPDTIFSMTNPINKNDELIVLYGNDECKVTRRFIKVGLDIMASTFFMLTRWEEYVVEKRDSHNRFSAYDSLAFRNDFLDKPIVNEYIEFLWSLLKHLGINQERRLREFAIIPTHDVDLPRMWWNGLDFAKSLGGDLLKRRSFKNAVSTTKAYLQKMENGKDPFDTFDYLMDISERNNVLSHFFFMSGGVTNKDNFYMIDHPVILKLLEKIDNRGHLIGFHPSYNSYNNQDQFNKELNLLRTLSPQPIIAGRQHFLRFQSSYTWRIWDNSDMEWDSTLCYADKEGFRCGVCYPFPVFDFINRKQLGLIERPLIVMDGSLVSYQALNPEDAYNNVKRLVETVKKYNGEFVFLWHNSAFNTPTWQPYQHIYEKILNENSNNSRSTSAIC